MPGLRLIDFFRLRRPESDFERLTDSFSDLEVEGVELRDIRDARYGARRDVQAAEIQQTITYRGVGIDA